MKRIGILFTFLALLSTPLVADESPLAPVKVDHPRDTMKTFMSAMNAYREAKEAGNSESELAQDQLERAVRTLNLSEVPKVLQEENGKEAAIFLKEVIDRVLVINYEKIPTASELASKSTKRWRMRNSEIVISQVESGERAGDYLFSPSTVDRAKRFYEKVKHLPYLKNSGGGAAYEPPLIERKVPAWARKKIVLFPNWKWIGLFIAIFIGLLIKDVAYFSSGILKKLTSKTRVKWDYQIVKGLERPISLMVACGFWFFSIHLLRFEGSALVFFTFVVQGIFSVALIWGLYHFSDFLTEYLMMLAKKTSTPVDDHLAPLVRKTIRIFVVIFGALVIFQNMGINVMSVLAGLGLGGLAFALAAKDACANLFGSLMILMDRPFKVGDWIIAGGSEGTVEEIGFRSTRLRTFYNSVISVPNSVIANANIDNMGKRQYRRVKAYFGLTYDTPPEKMEAFVEGVKNIVKANPYTRKDYFHVVFDSYGDFSLNVLLYCFLKVKNWPEELVQKQNLFLEVLRLAEKIGVSFAFPTSTIHVDSLPGQPSVSKGSASVEELKQKAADFNLGGKESKPSGLGIFHPPHREASSS